MDVEKLIEALEKCKDYIKRRNNAGCWWDDPYAYKTVTEVVEPAIAAFQSPPPVERVPEPVAWTSQSELNDVARGVTGRMWKTRGEKFPRIALYATPVASSLREGTSYNSVSSHQGVHVLTDLGKIHQSGWKLVPPNITDEMIEAWYGGDTLTEAYRRMLAASPDSTKATGGEDAQK